MDTFTTVNRLDVPEIAHYQRTADAGRVVIVYAVRGPLMSLWTGVRIVRDTDGTTEHHTGPVPSAALAARHAASAQLAPA